MTQLFSAVDYKCIGAVCLFSNFFSIHVKKFITERVSFFPPLWNCLNEIQVEKNKNYFFATIKWLTILANAWVWLSVYMCVFKYSYVLFESLSLGWKRNWASQVLAFREPSVLNDEQYFKVLLWIFLKFTPALILLYTLSVTEYFLLSF